MNEHDLAETLIRDHVLAARALSALQMRQLDDGVRDRVNQAIANRTGFIELRTRIETSETEPVLVTADGTDPLWLARTHPLRDLDL